MKVCVTGANGFVGRELVKRILNEFDEIRILTRRSQFHIDSPKIKIFTGDLTSETIPLPDFIEDCDIVFHCAGELRNKTKMKALHVGGTKKLIDSVLAEAQRKNKTIHFVHLSSVGVYGKADGLADRERIITENSPLNPAGEYETTKSDSDLLLINNNRLPYLSYSILRPSNIIGPNMANNSFYKMADMIKRGLFFYIGKPQSIATYVHVDDVVDALFLLAKSPQAVGRIYNLSNDCLFEEVIESISNAFHVSAPKLRVPEICARILSSTLGAVPGFPLTGERIDALVVRTRYPITQICNELSFQPRRYIPSSIADIIREK